MPSLSWIRRAGCVVLVMGAPALAQQGPDLVTIRKTSPLSSIDLQSLQDWVEQGVARVIASGNVEQDGPQFRGQVLEHYAAGTPAFKEALARSLAESLGRHYQGKTSITDANVARPFPIICLVMCQAAFEDPVGVEVFRRALGDPTAGVRAAGVSGLSSIRAKLKDPQWAEVLADAEKAGAAETDPVALRRLYRLLCVDDARGQQALPVVQRVLEARFTRFEKDSEVPMAADREPAVWLGQRALTAQGARRGELARYVARLLADAAHAYANQRITVSQREQLERVVEAAEQQLKKLVPAGAAQADVTKAVLDGGQERARRVNDELIKWIGGPQGAGLLNAAPFSFPRGLNIQWATPTTSSAPAIVAGA